jgi:hypothetical protein
MIDFNKTIYSFGKIYEDKELRKKTFKIYKQKFGKHMKRGERK